MSDVLLLKIVLILLFVVFAVPPPMDNNKRKRKRSKKKKDIPKQQQLSQPQQPQQQISIPVPVPKIPHQQNQHQESEPPPAFSGGNNGNYNPSLNNALSHEKLWQQSHFRHNNYPMSHIRTVSEQIPQKSFPMMSQNMLPNFLEDDEKDDLQQPSMYMIYDLDRYIAYSNIYRLYETE